MHVLCWNLLIGSSNIVNLHLSHFQWSEDAMTIYFAHSKNDQTGENSQIPRHVYANLVNGIVFRFN